MELKEGMIIHCKTEEEAKEFIKQAYKQGFKWYNGEDKDKTHFNVYYDDTVYSLGIFSSSHNDIVYGTIKGRNRNEVIEYSDLIKKDYKDFKKSDLKNGMIVETREGKRYLVHNNKLLHSDGDNYMAIDGWTGFDDDLKDVFGKSNKYDIMRVYNSRAIILNSIFDDNYLTLLWEREEKIEIKANDFVEIISDISEETIDAHTYKYTYDTILNSNMSEKDKNFMLAKYDYGKLPIQNHKYRVEYVGFMPILKQIELAIISDYNNCYIVNTSILEKVD